MFICLGCNNLFVEPKKYIEKHGLDTPPYEEYLGCPKCGDGFVETKQCEYCGEYAENEYIIITNNNGTETIICDKHYKIHNLNNA